MAEKPEKPEFDKDNVEKKSSGKSKSWRVSDLTARIYETLEARIAVQNTKPTASPTPTPQPPQSPQLPQSHQLPQSLPPPQPSQPTISESLPLSGIQQQLADVRKKRSEIFKAQQTLRSQLNVGTAADRLETQHKIAATSTQFDRLTQLQRTLQKQRAAIQVIPKVIQPDLSRQHPFIIQEMDSLEAPNVHLEGSNFGPRDRKQRKSTIYWDPTVPVRRGRSADRVQSFRMRKPADYFEFTAMDRRRQRQDEDISLNKRIDIMWNQLIRLIQSPHLTIDLTVGGLVKFTFFCARDPSWAATEWMEAAYPEPAHTQLSDEVLRNALLRRGILRGRTERFMQLRMQNAPLSPNLERLLVFLQRAETRVTAADIRRDEIEATATYRTRAVRGAFFVELESQRLLSRWNMLETRFVRGLHQPLLSQFRQLRTRDIAERLMRKTRQLSETHIAFGDREIAETEWHLAQRQCQEISEVYLSMRSTQGVHRDLQRRRRELMRIQVVGQHRIWMLPAQQATLFRLTNQISADRVERTIGVFCRLHGLNYETRLNPPIFSYDDFAPDSGDELTGFLHIESAPVEPEPQIVPTQIPQPQAQHDSLMTPCAELLRENHQAPISEIEQLIDMHILSAGQDPQGIQTEKRDLMRQTLVQLEMARISTRLQEKRQAAQEELPSRVRLPFKSVEKALTDEMRLSIQQHPHFTKVSIEEEPQPDMEIASKQAQKAEKKTRKSKEAPQM